MASRAEQLRQNQATEQRRQAALAKIVSAAIADTDDGGQPNAVDVLSTLIEAIDGEAAEARELRRKGWQSRATALDTTKTEIQEWALRLTAYTPPKPIEPPTPAEITPRTAVPGYDLEQRLVDSFGPELAPVRHIRTVLEHNPAPDDGSTTYGPLCGSKTGSFTHPGGANCEECHALYTEQNGGKPYAVRNSDVLLTEVEQNEVRDLTPKELAAIESRLRGPVRRDEPITPTVAREIREEIEAEQTAAEQAAANNSPDPYPQYIVGDKVTVGGVKFTKHSEWPRELDGSPSPGTAADVAAVTQFGTFNDGQMIHDGDTVSITLPNGSVATGTAHNTVTSGTSTTADLAGVKIVEPPTVRPSRTRLTLAQVREHGLSRQRGLHHRSVSQVQGYADCGTRYALSDLERPAWWNVGGKAFHACAEEINHSAHAEGFGPLALDTDGARSAHESFWLYHFDAAIAEQTLAAPDHPPSTWRAANRGSEHYDWWRVEGPAMVTKYVQWLSGMHTDGWRIATVPAGPVIEYEVTMDVGASVPNLSIIDLALTRAHQKETHAHGGAELLIVDLKAGGSPPKDTFQLGVYGWALVAAGVTRDPSSVRGAYYRARKGTIVPDVASRVGWPVLDLHPWPDVVQRYRDQDAMERQGIYMPNVTNFCGGCGVRDLCPAQRDDA